MCAWGLAVLVLGLYLATAAPNPWWGDGCELASAAVVLGVPHPTGYPLYVVVAHVFIKLMGFVEPGRATTILDAVLLAVACGMTALLLRRVIGSKSTASLLIAAGLAALIAISRTVWDHATVTEVYPLTYFMCIAVLLVVWTDPAKPPGIGRAALLGGLVGLASLNHYSIIAYFPLTGLIVLEWTWRRKWGVKLAYCATTIACWLVMLSGYLYLPLRARVNPPLNWGNPDTLARIKWVLTGGQFGVTNKLIWEGGPAHGTLRWLQWWGEQWLPGSHGALTAALGVVVIAPAVIGLLMLARRRPAMGSGLLMVLVATICFSIYYHIVDIGSYFLPALPVFAIGWIEFGRAAIGRRIRLMPNLAAAMPLVLAVLIAAARYGEMDKSSDVTPVAYGTAVFNALPRDSILLVRGDYPIFSLWYQQMALGKRPDVVVLGTNFLNEAWYQRYFEAAGRPRVPFRVKEPVEFPTRYEFDLMVMRDFVMPCFAAGKRVFIAYPDEVLDNFFSPTFVTVLPPGKLYREVVQTATLLPDPWLAELHPNPGLAAMSRDEVEAQFRRFFLKVFEKDQRP
ncbi:DUF2723 domain-containing protein [bacterium]|nr:DUF2723 domain-containing protein [bacterium]